jgi:hypothetical protein
MLQHHAPNFAKVEIIQSYRMPTTIHVKRAFLVSVAASIDYIFFISFVLAP